MTEVETMKRKAELLSLKSPRSPKHLKMEDIQEQNGTCRPSGNSDLSTTATTCDASKGNITIIHIQTNPKHGGSRMQWTFPRAYIVGRTRSTTPQSPSSNPTRSDSELNTSNLPGSFTTDAIAVFYEAITTETSVSSYGHSLHEYCQIYALAQFFEVQDIFEDGEAMLLRRVMGDDTPLDAIRSASGLASIFRWRALVERCRLLLGRKVRLLETDLKTMNCGGLNILASKMNEVYEFMAKSGFLNASATTETRREK